MGSRRLIVLAVLAACSAPAPASVVPAAPPPEPAPPPLAPLAAKVAADFEAATLASKDAYVALFDFDAVGEYEILLHRYKLNGRLVNLEPDQKAALAAEDGTPYPAARERRNVGNFYPLLAQRTVGTGQCAGAVPRTHFARLLGLPFDPLPAGTPPGYTKLRDDANGWLAHGGAVGIRCAGGRRGVAVVYTERPNERGYDLITIYDD